LEQYAKETGFGYCKGCGNVCESAVTGNVPISDIMRCLMYYDGYEDHARAIGLFNKIPNITRTQLTSVNYSKAENLCPQKMPITHLMNRAVEEFTKT